MAGSRTPQPGLTLPADAVHVWRAGLDPEAKLLRRLERNLSAGELARAARFRFTLDQRRFIAARGLLREILALYVDAAPQQLSFRYGAHGKPFLAEHSNLRFNLSHSLGTALLAVSHEREVGVDVEHMPVDLAVEEIAETVFSAPEKTALSRLDGEARRTAFLRFWTHKEAYIKADGRGVSLPLDHIDVSLPAGRVAVLDENLERWRVCERWTLRTLAVGSDCAAAVAAEAQNWRLVRWQWPP